MCNVKNNPNFNCERSVDSKENSLIMCQVRQTARQTDELRKKGSGIGQRTKEKKLVKKKSSYQLGSSSFPDNQPSLCPQFQCLTQVVFPTWYIFSFSLCRVIRTQQPTVLLTLQWVNSQTKSKTKVMLKLCYLVLLSANQVLELQAKTAGAQPKA